MIRELNRFLRKVILVVGGLFLLLDLVSKKKTAPHDKEGFDNEEFDDIW